MPLKGIMNPKIATPSSNQGKILKNTSLKCQNARTILNESMNHPTKGLALLWVAFADLASRIPQINPENNKCL